MIKMERSAELTPQTCDFPGANFVLHAERRGLFTANREGILSSAGYLSPALRALRAAEIGAAWAVAATAHPTRPSHAFR